MGKMEKIYQALERMDPDDVLSIHNLVCSETGNEREIWDMWDFDEIMSGFKPFEVAQRCSYGNFNPNHSYFMLDGSGNLESMYDALVQVDLDWIAYYILDSGDDLGYPEISRVLRG